MIGIGNSSAFASKLDTQKEIVFGSYTSDQLCEIARGKLSESVCDRLLDKSALKLWASKVSNEMGDLRTAMACLVRAIDVVQANTISDPSACPKVSLSVIRHVLDGWSSTKGSLASVTALSPQARLLLVALYQHKLRSPQPQHYVFADKDVRAVFCSVFRVDRPDSGQLRSLLGNLLDTPFVRSEGQGTYKIELDEAVVAQLAQTDQGVNMLVN